MTNNRKLIKWLNQPTGLGFWEDQYLDHTKSRDFDLYYDDDDIDLIEYPKDERSLELYDNGRSVYIDRSSNRGRAAYLFKRMIDLVEKNRMWFNHKLVDKSMKTEFYKFMMNNS
jgi:hypothetical protein